MTRAITVSVSIVVFRPKLAVLATALASLHAALTAAARERPLTALLHVIDNSCDPALHARIVDVVRQRFPEGPAMHAELIVSPKNVGYGRANNLAIERVASDYHLVMNPDVYVAPAAISQALAYMERNPRVGLLVPDVRGEDGARHYLCKQDPRFPLMILRGFGPRWLQTLLRSALNHFELRHREYDDEIEGIEFPTGCFMFFRTPALQQLGGFDPRFFLYFEDADIGRRMRRIASICYVPQVRITHLWARGAHNSWRLRWIAVRSALLYFSKWGGFVGFATRAVDDPPRQRRAPSIASGMRSALTLPPAPAWSDDDASHTHQPEYHEGM